MKKRKNTYRKDILILNQPHLIKEDQFYFQLFRVPEVLSRLKQYREALNKNNINIPLWVYNLTQDLKIFTEGHKPFVLNFLISLGFFDRYIAYNGWPRYIIGSNPLMSVLVGNISFEEQVLLLSHGYCYSSSKLQLYHASSFYNIQTDSFHLNSLKKEPVGGSMRELLQYFRAKLKKDWKECFFQLLSPHGEEFTAQLADQGVFARDFLEFDSSLKWLWPDWKKSQLQYLKNRLSRKNSSSYTDSI